MELDRSYRLPVSVLVVATRFVLEEMAALRTFANSGLIPQVKHGSSGNASVAMVGSKFGGTGFGNVQIGQIHVPLSTWGVAARTGGLGARDTGDDAEASLCNEGDWLPRCRRTGPKPRFSGFGCRVIFADDLRKPA